VLTMDRRSDDAAIALEETYMPFADRDQTGYGISRFTGLTIPSGTGDQPTSVYLEASRVYPGSFPLALVGESIGLLAEFLGREWGAQLAHAWSEEPVIFAPPENVREVEFEIRRIFIGVPSSAGSEE
jgi:hypothetical protein